MFYLIVEKISFFLINLIFILLTIALFTLVERKIMGSVQRRKGPNLTGIYGFLQPFADGLKLVLKELITPSNSNIYISILSPVITFLITLYVFLMIPTSSGYIISESNFSLLIILSISSLSVHGIIFPGWSSNSKYASLGSIRSASQIISYEICISTIYLCIASFSGSYSIVNIVEKQAEVWFIFPLFPLWLLFVIAALAETNRAPFDLPEAEAELVAGYNVEYSAIAFAMSSLAEYGNISIISSISIIFFLGGWYLPSSTYGNAIIFSVKLSIHILLPLLIRAAFPRYRFDHLMKLRRKNIIPITSTVFIFQSSLMFLFDIFPNI